MCSKSSVSCLQADTCASGQLSGFFEVWGFPNMGGVRNPEREAQVKILRRLAQAHGLALVAENASRPQSEETC